jgi:hypothetical protein
MLASSKRMAGRKASASIDVDMLADELGEFVVKNNFVQYGCNMDKSIIDPAKILPHKKMIAMLHNKYANIAAETMKAALAEVCKKKFADAVDVDEWADEKQKMVRTMLRHLAQAKMKNPATKWVTGVLGLHVEGKAEKAEAATFSIVYDALLEKVKKVSTDKTVEARSSTQTHQNEKVKLEKSKK